MISSIRFVFSFFITFFIASFLFTEGNASSATPKSLEKFTLEDSKTFNDRAGYSLRSISTIDEVPVGTIMPWPSTGTPIPYSWLPCDGRSITMSAFSRMPEQWLRDKWLKHAKDVIGAATPIYNYSTQTPGGEGVFLRGKFGAGDYAREYNDTFRSHNHEQPKHTHPITLNVEDGRANGKFDPQKYADFYTRKAANNRSLSDASNPLDGKGNIEGTRAYQRHLAAAGGIGGLQRIDAVGTLVSNFTFPINNLRTKVEYTGGTGRCTYYNYHGDGFGSHPLDSGTVSVPTGKINSTSSVFSWENNKNARLHGIFDSQETFTVEGKYKGTMDDPTVIGEILPSGGDTSHTNRNRHDKNNDGVEDSWEETSNEKETAPVNAEVMYIIKIHP